VVHVFSFSVKDKSQCNDAGFTVQDEKKQALNEPGPEMV
jgi:hypothetical protein